MNKLRILVVLLVTTGMLFLNVSTVLALPPFPSSFYGTVKLGGANVPAGTQVFAYINGVQYASSPYLLYNGDTVYSLNVPGDDPSTPDVIEGGVAGDTVVFYIGSTRADQTAPWVAGSNVNLNLSATPGYNLSVNKTGTGSGTVSSLPAGIDCGLSCSAGFPKNTSVNLTATAAAGSTFTSWSGACSVSSTCTVFMDDAKSVTAAFTINTYLLSVSKNGLGTITSDTGGINCGSTCSASYNYGTSVLLTATASTGYTFTGWSGACTNSSGTCTVTMDAAKSVTATFTINTYLLSVSKNGLGTITSDTGGINCGSTCSASYNYGTSVVLTATASTGYTFAGWSGACTNSSGTCTVSMTTARSVTATFTINTYTLTVSKTGTGSGTVTSLPAGIDCGSTCSASFNYNTSVTLTAVAATGSTFTGWSGGVCSGSLSTCVVSLTTARSVTASFVLSQYSLTTSVVGNGSITRDNVGPYYFGNVVQLTAVPNPGWSFSGWSGDLGGSLNPASITINADKAVTATFTQNVFTLTIIKTGTGSGMVSSLPTGIDCGATCSYDFAENTVVTLAASPLSRSIFGGWSGAGCSGTNTCTLTMDMAKSVTATFIAPQYIFIPLILIH